MKLKSKVIVLISLFVLLIGSNLVRAANFPVRVIDDLGREVIIEERPTRIISLAPSNTEILFELGLAEEVVGVSQYADYPEAATKITKVGTIKGINLERILQLRPDLVLASGITPKDLVFKLEQFGIKVIGFNPKSIDEIIDSISLIGKATGQVEEASRLTTKMRDKIEKISQIVADEPRLKVFYEVWQEPLYTAGPGTYVDDLIYLAGGINIAHDAKGVWPQYNLEVLLAKNPDVYLLSNHGVEGKFSKEVVKERENFGNIKAIKQGRIYILNPDIVNRAGPRIIIALEKIAKAIHPELFD
ncbi:ABC transporter substrate-binding protein [Orenia marismortui]|uniref:Iron complex transport system substrate-binding protein n=1 Tax=Orenia marismortui TaxID=46469 RepID=A0A4R8H9Z2_9FIRM|nr:cobalamin-binding protein [Orenia marismortui]TDX53003.1 iron complex transport system substrate-binding protein [Orenia marismortui]